MRDETQPSEREFDEDVFVREIERETYGGV